MAEEPQRFHNYDDGGNSNLLRNVLLGIVAVYVIFSLYFSYSLSTRLSALESKQTADAQQLGKKIAATQSEIEASSADLNSSL